MRSANAAMRSSAATITAPIAPSGLRRANRPIATSQRRGPPPRRPAAGAPTAPLRASLAAGELTSVPDPRVQHRVEGVDGEIDHDRGRDDQQVHALEHRVVTLVERVEEEPA